MKWYTFFVSLFFVLSCQQKAKDQENHKSEDSLTAEVVETQKTNEFKGFGIAVSYTHLTLPTTSRV